MQRRNRTLNLLWQLPLACFILAGLNGFLYRLGLVGVDLQGLYLNNIRHAHSHLMFFCWAVPLPMYFMIKKVHRQIHDTGPPILMARMAMAALIFGLLSHPFFMFYGYRPVPIAGMDMPLSVIFSGLVMLCWYGFIASYWKERKFVDSDLATQLYDAALLMLFVSSLGAWGVAVVQFSGVDNPLLGMALTHFFLATFTEGWVVLVLLAVMFHKLNVDEHTLPVSPALIAVLILIGAPLTFPYGISEGLMSPKLMIAARFGGGLVAMGMLLALFVVIRQKHTQLPWYWQLVIGLTAVKAVAQLAASVLPSAFWMANHGLRIFYLHLLLLGAFTFMLFVAIAMQQQSRKELAFLAVTIIAVLISLMALTPFWPSSWFGANWFTVIAVIAVLPSLAAGWFWFNINRNKPR